MFSNYKQKHILILIQKNLVTFVLVAIYQYINWKLKIKNNYKEILFFHWEFFSSTSADGPSLEWEWQQVSSSLQDASQYSDQYQ